jgi:hypothetical protein
MRSEVLGWDLSGNATYLYSLLIIDDETELSRLLRSWSKHGAPKLVQPFLFRLDY